ncbi:MAG: recombinase family protein [Hydrogenoanaerobacterium sp.]
MTSTTKEVAMYLRKSRMEELMSEEEVLERHKKALTDEAKRQSLNVTGIYEEVVSGDTLYSRPQMLRLLADVETDRYSAVLCMEIDRLGRSSMSEQGVILETFKQHHTKIITPRKIYDLNNDIDETYSEFESFMARQELKIIKRRLHNGIQRTICDGGYIANAPYGYTKTTKNKTPTLEINESEAYYVRMIFEMYVNEGVGCQIIADTINSLGAKPHRSDKFGRTSIAAIIKNQVYIGKIIWNKKTCIRRGTKGNAKHITIYNSPEKWTSNDGLHPSIIDKELFASAQEIMRMHYHPPYYKGTVENPLAGIVRCGNCQHIMQRQICAGPSNRNIKVDYLLCQTKKCVPSAKLEFVVAAVLKYLNDTLETIEVELKSRIIPKQNVTSMKAMLRASEKELNTLEIQRAKLHDFLEQGIYDVEMFRSRSKLLDEKSKILTKQISEQQKTIKQAKGTDKAKIYKKIKNVLEAYGNASPQKQNTLLKSVISDAVYFKKPKSKPQDFLLSITLKDL